MTSQEITGLLVEHWVNAGCEIGEPHYYLTDWAMSKLIPNWEYNSLTFNLTLNITFCYVGRWRSTGVKPDTVWYINHKDSSIITFRLSELM